MNPNRVVARWKEHVQHVAGIFGAMHSAPCLFLIRHLLRIVHFHSLVIIVSDAHCALFFVSATTFLPQQPKCSKISVSYILQN